VATVLIVDDQKQICELVRRILERAGFSVFTANSGSEAVAVSSSQDCCLDLLVSDVEMPGMDGVTLVRQLRSRCPGLPVILMSGRWHESVRGVSRPAQFLSKPFSLAALTRLAREMCSPPDGPCVVEGAAYTGPVPARYSRFRSG
jgi:two-component system cell cycle sensor histidine kinase/response regulator CckA